MARSKGMGTFEAIAWYVGALVLSLVAGAIFGTCATLGISLVPFLCFSIFGAAVTFAMCHASIQDARKGY